MRVKSLVTSRSKSIEFDEGKMEKPAIPNPSTFRETSKVTEEQIQSLVDRGLLQPKSQVGWRPAVGEALLTDKTRIHLRSASVQTYTFFTMGFPRFLSIRGARGLLALNQVLI
jgi:hypothetical protein